MVKSLCGQYPCPRVCVRVCHCPAGMERVHFLWLLRRGYRPASEPRPSSSRPCPPNVDPTTGEISQPRHYLGKVKEAVLYNLFGAQQYPKRRRPIRYGTTNLKPYASTAILTCLLAFVAIVIAFGFLVNGPQIIPGYEVPNVIAYDW